MRGRAGAATAAMGRNCDIATSRNAFRGGARVGQVGTSRARTSGNLLTAVLAPRAIEFIARRLPYRFLSAYP